MTAPGSFWAVLLTALSSLVLPGSGHIIAGYWRTGILFAMLRMLLPFIAVIFFLRRPSLMAALPIAAAIWLVALASAVHASVLVRTRGRRPGAPGPRRAGVILMVMLALFWLFQTAQSTYFTQTYRPLSGSLAPTLRAGDYVLADRRASPWGGRPLLNSGTAHSRSRPREFRSRWCRVAPCALGS